MNEKHKMIIKALLLFGELSSIIIIITVFGYTTIIEILTRNMNFIWQRIPDTTEGTYLTWFSGLISSGFFYFFFRTKRLEMLIEE